MKKNKNKTEMKNMSAKETFVIKWESEGMDYVRVDNKIYISLKDMTKTLEQVRKDIFEKHDNN